MIQTESCFICGGKLLIKGTLKLAQCANCGFGITLNKTSQNYSDYHRDSVYLESEKQFINIFQKRVSIVQKYIKSGKVLEIGSSSGLMLSQFKKNVWDVVGVEPSRSACEVSKKRGIKTLNDTFENAKFEKESFDLVILNHVLEHMENPESVLKKIDKLLKDDGYILIDVPNFGSLSAKIWGDRWKYILPNEHKWHFTFQSLDCLLTKTGFKMAYSETHSGVWEYGDPLKELFQSLFGGKKRFFSEAISLFPAYFVSKFGMGTGLTILAKK